MYKQHYRYKEKYVFLSLRWTVPLKQLVTICQCCSYNFSATPMWQQQWVTAGLKRHQFFFLATGGQMNSTTSWWPSWWWWIIFYLYIQLKHSKLWSYGCGQQEITNIHSPLVSWFGLHQLLGKMSKGTAHSMFPDLRNHLSKYTDRNVVQNYKNKTKVVINLE